MLTIYDYQKPERFIYDRWLIKNKINPSFSMRAWAKKLNLKGHAMLQQMLAGKKKIPKKYIPVFIKSLDLTAREGAYLDTLVDLQRAKTIEEKEIYSERLKDLSPKRKVSFVEVETYKYLSDPLHVLIQEMIDLPNFNSSPKWIKDRLAFNATEKEISDAKERLISLGLLTENPDGSLKKVRNATTNLVDVPSVGVQEFHQRISTLAALAVKNQDVKDREFNSYAMNIKKKDLREAKELIREFIKTFMTRIEAPKNGDETYQLNIQFFGMTNNKEK